MYLRLNENTTMKELELIPSLSSITAFNTDAIVNSAHQTLTAGSGISGAIHSVAGAGLANECQRYKKLEVGQSVLTKAYNLPCEYVIHTSAPRWYHCHLQRESQFSDCYKSIIQLCEMMQFRDLAIPPIGMGVYKWPAEQAIEIAINAIITSISEKSSLKSVYFCTNGNIELLEFYKLTIKKYQINTE